MANITGTNGEDKLTGTAGDDTINALGGNDRIIGSNGSDVIDGGAGNNTLDYSSAKGYIEFRNVLSGDLPDPDAVQKAEFAKIIKPPADFFIEEIDKIKNIETIIGPAKKPNSIYISDVSFGDSASADIDLSKNLLKYSSVSVSSGKTNTVKIENFTDATVYVAGSSRLKGNDLDNKLVAISNLSNVIVGSKGNDQLGTVGGIIDYSDLGRAVKFVPIGYVSSSRYGTVASVKITINKNGFGIDRVTGNNKIIGATNKANSIDASTDSSLGSIDVNLANNSLKIYSVDQSIPISDRTVELDIVNFVDVIGSKYNDKIVGANKKGKLTGGGGNDSITGGSKNDIITGSDSTARGVGELDTLTGGGGRDKFVLGDKNGAYYVGKGNNDYALITDFNVFQDSISIGSLKNYSFALAGNNTIDLYSGKDVKTRDLIAKIQIAGGISTVSSNAKSAMSPDASLNALVGKINIISG